MKRHLTFAVAGIFVALAVGAVLAQQPSGPPKPGPEHQKLAYFAGKWASEGETKASAFGPAGKFTGSETCEWFDGNFALICRSEGKFGDTTFKGLSVMGYDAAEKTYVYFETNTFGETVFSRGSVAGDTWTWNNTSTMNGKPVHARFTLKQASPDSATYKFEMASGDAPLAVIMEGKQTRQK